MSTFRYDPLFNPYGSHRMPVYAKNGMVATSHKLASQIGPDILKRGGSRSGGSGKLNGVEPNSTSIGGDAFALVWTNGKLHGLNASGPSPKRMTIETFRQAGYDKLEQPLDIGSVG